MRSEIILKVLGGYLEFRGFVEVWKHPRQFPFYTRSLTVIIYKHGVLSRE